MTAAGLTTVRAAALAATRRAAQVKGYVVREVGPADAPWSGPDDSPARRAQRAVAQALGLPETAGRNLDALTDCLRDVDRWRAAGPRVVVLLHHASTLLAVDPQGWARLAEVLAEPGARGPGPQGEELRVVAVLDDPGSSGQV